MRPSSTVDISIIGEDKAQELLTSFVDEYVLRYICMFIIESYSMDIGKELEFLGNQDISQSIADKKSLEANSYIQQLMNKWKGWLDCDKIINASPIYLFLYFLANTEGKLNNDLSRWCESQPNENFENIKLFEKNIKEIHTSWIESIFNNKNPDTAYNQFLSILDESILDSSDFLISAVKEAENWFSFLQRCISIYFKDYALYIPFFKEIQNGLLIAHIDNNGLDNAVKWQEITAEKTLEKAIMLLRHNCYPISIVCQYINSDNKLLLGTPLWNDILPL